MHGFQSPAIKSILPPTFSTSLTSDTATRNSSSELKCFETPDHLDQWVLPWARDKMVDRKNHSGVIRFPFTARSHSAPVLSKTTWGPNELTPGQHRSQRKQTKFRNPMATIVLTSSDDEEEKILEKPIAPLAFLSEWFYEQAIRGQRIFTIPAEWGSHEAARWIFELIETLSDQDKSPRKNNEPLYRLSSNISVNLGIYAIARQLGIQEITTWCSRYITILANGSNALLIQDFDFVEKTLPRDDPVHLCISDKVAGYMRKFKDDWDTEQIRGFLKGAPNMSANIECNHVRHTSLMYRELANKEKGSAAKAVANPVNTDVDPSAWANPAFAGKVKGVVRRDTVGYGARTRNLIQKIMKKESNKDTGLRSVKTW